MDTTPGEFRWALAPDLVSWSSDRDREFSDAQYQTVAPNDGTSTTKAMITIAIRLRYDYDTMIPRRIRLRRIARVCFHSMR